MSIVLIVGASSGIGYECAKTFLREGYKVLALSRTECVLAGVKNYLCDVSKEEELEQTLDRLLDEYPSVDNLVYSAGCSMACPLEFVDPVDYRYLFEVNFFGFVHCLRRLIPTLRRCEGTACVVSSIGAVAPIPFDSYYVASKAALNSLCMTLATELASRGVRVVSVMPGGTKTNFTFKRKIYPPEKIGDYKIAQENAVEKLAKIEQSGASPSKIAETIYRLCTQRSGVFLTTAGWKNKFLYAVIKILPQRLLTFLTRSVYLSCDDQ